MSIAGCGHGDAAEPDRPLAGPRWSVATLVERDTAASVPAGAEAYRVFEAGRVTGSAGLHATRRVPSPTAIRQSLSYRIIGARLALTHPDGRALQLRAASRTRATPHRRLRDSGPWTSLGTVGRDLLRLNVGPLARLD
ncbi:hypothetical protein [Krasilnikovia sp. M28-CT-15]|uniref:hypothetical protein n=1 Tax=Krasilnikovia sp. M28-CT-15 TaxID=3373540 RepID=UPI0038769EAF